MSAGQESGSPIRENRTLLPASLPPDEARGTLAAAAGVCRVGAKDCSLAPLTEPDMRARIRLFGLIYQNSSDSWSDAGGRL